MSTAHEKVLIFEYWFRVIVGVDISIENISKIAAEYAHEHEMFIESLTCGEVSIENDGKVLTTKSDTHSQAFGSAIASRGRKYHWEIKVIDTGFQNLNVGIVKSDADVSKSIKDKPFWTEKTGYSYYSMSGIYNDGDKCEWDADQYDNRDTIGI